MWQTTMQLLTQQQLDSMLQRMCKATIFRGMQFQKGLEECGLNIPELYKHARPSLWEINIDKGVAEVSPW
jgi:hypothetical protein